MDQELARLRAEIEALRAENERLREEVEALQQENDDLHFDADLDACHLAGLIAQARAVIAEGDACPNKAAHPLLERAEFINSRTGEKMIKTRSYPLFREGFDAEARELGIDDPEKYRG
ncbi:hypothetical protein [Telmatospirillum sp. J64-1]|uniref:hypothetical protein n=1 Tax=Telmatospirillum sp. J64-1 TaxID=2502183 RepID=UPI002105CE58|nr:hypothetical protein [Telmatospirillum sp. J64-1]